MAWKLLISFSPSSRQYLEAADGDFRPLIEKATEIMLRKNPTRGKILAQVSLLAAASGSMACSNAHCGTMEAFLPTSGKLNMRIK